LRQRTADLSEALEQQTATADVLRVISASPGELNPVFNAMLESAVRLCEAEFGHLFLYDRESFHTAALHSASQRLGMLLRRRPVVLRGLHPDAPLARMARTKAVVHIADVRLEKIYIEREPTFSEFVDVSGARAILIMPMLNENELIGAFVIYRLEVRPFTDKQIELVKNFAAQAVIAIENTRLLNELRESLDWQTATSQVLQIISSSQGELEPVFQKILANAVRICDAKFGTLFRIENEIFSPLALFDVPPPLVEFIRQRGSYRPDAGVTFDRLLRTKDVIETADAMAEPVPNAVARFGGARSVINVPMLKDNDLIGVIAIHQEVRPFTDKQIELVKNFAAQAVIAIENARLLNELRQSLEQQTGTATVLGVISSSPGELPPVYDAMLQNAVRLCDAKFGNIYRWDGDAFSLVATHNTPPALIEARRSAPFRPHPDTGMGRIVATKTLAHIADLAAEQTYSERKPAIIEAVELGGIRTFLAVPMLKEDVLVGAITIFRQEVRPFTEKQIALVQNFAAQAVIAIENARLLTELRERTEQLEVRSREVVKLNQQLEQRVADQVGEIERMGRLRRFLPPQVADLIVASGTEKQLESHRREITALFCDLRGFTGFSESSDPEDVMALLRDYHAAIGEIIIKYSGTLERYAGDGVMVVFNDPVPVENPALQAVLMALEMRDAIGALTETWHRWGHDIGFGIGIAHGFATLGTIGFEGRFDYAAIGTVSNVASRICDEAKPGQILISPRVLTKVENAVTVEPVGEFALKGIRRPMMAYNVLESSPSKLN
jgi:GAF domain-containing protein